MGEGGGEGEGSAGEGREKDGYERKAGWAF